MKLSTRYSVNSLASNSPDKHGRLFFSEHSGFVDLSTVEIVGASTDTVRQLFMGCPWVEMIDTIEKTIDAGKSIIVLAGVTGFKEWHITRMGKASRYRYKLQDNEEGIVILFCAYNAKITNIAQHLKIELSPHFINSRTPMETWSRLYDKSYGIAFQFLTDPQPKGCALHLACDYQNYALPTDFIDKFTTHARAYRAYDGIGTLDLSDISESITTYGGKNLHKNYLIGKPSAVQLCAYDKTYEMVRSDKSDYFNDYWGRYTQGVHNPNKTTRRIELRLHHSVIREFGEYLGVDFDSYINVVEHLTAIWRFALFKNRLHSDVKRKHLHPFWQLLMEDVEFLKPSDGLILKRKKKQTVASIGKNLSLALGNMISIWARNRLSYAAVMRQIKNLSFYQDLVDYYHSRGLTECHLKDYVRDSLILRRLVGKAA